VHEPIRVLIADDSRGFCELFATQCSRTKGVEVVAMAFDGESAVQATAKQQPDVVVLDIILSKLDGLGVMEAINGLHLQPRPKFVVISALALDRVTQLAVGQGAEYYFVKPIDTEVVIQRILELSGSASGPKAPVRAGAAPMGPAYDSMEAAVTLAIQRIGIPPHIRGYRYVRDAIMMVARDMSLLKSVTTQLYPRIAKKYDTLPTRVERALRHAIEVAWTRGDMDAIQEYFGFTVDSEKGKPTNSEFIAMIADRVTISMGPERFRQTT
jgi:two-component system response regulator (stage 0 sporulation protein A)